MNWNCTPLLVMRGFDLPFYLLILLVCPCCQSLKNFSELFSLLLIRATVLSIGNWSLFTKLYLFTLWIYDILFSNFFFTQRFGIILNNSWQSLLAILAHVTIIKFFMFILPRAQVLRGCSWRFWYLFNHIFYSRKLANQLFKKISFLKLYFFRMNYF